MTNQKTTRIPRMTLSRLPLYYRTLCNLADEGTRRIKSADLGTATQVEPTTIRRDFSYFGELGRSGYGYDVGHLIRIFGEILEVDEPQYLALVGVGNLGRALLKNNFRRNPNMAIVCAFDADPGVIGEEINQVIVQPMAELGATIASLQINTAISTVPSHSLQQVSAKLVDNGIRSILSFAPEPVILPEFVNMRYLDLTSEVLNLLLLSERGQAAVAK
ncbi:redox-sensing transcriptional repressor Rex [Lapidilactobacillus achengensis]|uniref:Redox-sensing transcriptional repressor Rex n=1 Tax=Lapidilactobacillus achengensis TaxID=2486000 RepID=A0ABW1USP4_9LACO|nr:redox-sensing transcriptional repressor Rex [Lapidilactobacillus achengensis]